MSQAVQPPLKICWQKQSMLWCSGFQGLDSVCCFERHVFEDRIASPNSRTMRLPLLFGLLVILLSHNASANIALDSKPHLAFRDRLHQKRFYNNWQRCLAPDGWKMSYITFEHFVPFQVAAAGLEQLYLTLAANAFASQYGSLAPSNAVFLRLGLINLMMLSMKRFRGHYCCRLLRLGCGQQQRWASLQDTHRSL